MQLPPKPFWKAMAAGRSPIGPRVSLPAPDAFEVAADGRNTRLRG